MVDVKTQGLMVRVLPGSTKDMELLDDHVLLSHVIPKGFVFDGASYIDEDNDVKCAALIHDYYYRMTEHDFTKAIVDEMFYQAMIKLGVPQTKARAIWMGVCFGGHEIWAKQQKDNPHLNK
ncbi:MAG: DUF1353 domain-containing protein [Sarcina sp.]